MKIRLAVGTFGVLLLASVCVAGSSAAMVTPTTIAYLPVDRPCVGSTMLPGASIGNVGTAASIVTDVAPVSVTYQRAIWHVGWIYTTRGGRYFQLAGTITGAPSSDGLRYTGSSPFVQFNGNYSDAIDAIMTFEGYTKKTAPPLTVPYTFLVNPGTAVIQTHSCYHA